MYTIGESISISQRLPSPRIRQGADLEMCLLGAGRVLPNLPAFPKFGPPFFAREMTTNTVLLQKVLSHLVGLKSAAHALLLSVFEVLQVPARQNQAAAELSENHGGTRTDARAGTLIKKKMVNQSKWSRENYVGRRFWQSPPLGTACVLGACVTTPVWCLWSTLPPQSTGDVQDVHVCGYNDVATQECYS